VGVFGLLNIHKPAGPTSHDVLDSIRRRLSRGVKSGHTGTLDPFAQGVLVVCVGPAVRLASYVQDRPKGYRTTIILGATSTTDDVTGTITPTPPAQTPHQRHVQEVLNGFVGRIRQVPPAYSAVHVNGQRAYKLARAGRPTELPAKDVAVHSIELLRYEYPRLELEVACGAGTYIRALARDIGHALSTGGYCETLVRTWVGPFRLEEAVSPDDVDPARHLLPARLAVEHLQQIELGIEDCLALAAGRPVRLPPDIAADLQVAPASDEPATQVELAVVDAQGMLFAIASPIPPAGTIRATKVFRR
jgi:tRNA pseudouridine55 synthase